ncbi:hypothetical protein TcasGA2_TC000022 [Tribolium castaneum]|uniref:Uncharacterized protein n=1 Tax=Tribolium castaneum TaxID=7070 RepID=D6WE87_TRICA|nr:hypothetical protein TcasGA2_TC000022 [Tribolium castaneum]
MIPTLRWVSDVRVGEPELSVGVRGWHTRGNHVDRPATAPEYARSRQTGAIANNHSHGLHVLFHIHEKAGRLSDRSLTKKPYRNSRSIASFSCQAADQKWKETLFMSPRGASI